MLTSPILVILAQKMWSGGKLAYGEDLMPHPLSLIFLPIPLSPLFLSFLAITPDLGVSCGPAHIGGLVADIEHLFLFS